MVLLLDPLSCCCEINTNNLLILYTILTTLPQPSLQLPAVNRRSALEGGHVSFPEKPRILRPFPTLSTSSTLAPTSQTLKLTSVVPVNSKEKIQTVKPLSVAISTTVATGHIRREWIPGHVKHHAYIPAHARNVFVPARPPVLSTVVIPTSTRRYNLYEDDRYRSHYGGFGVGVDYGGQGAGHGFQVAL